MSARRDWPVAWARVSVSRVVNGSEPRARGQLPPGAQREATLAGASASLSAWYGDPLGRTEAERLLLDSGRRCLPETPAGAARLPPPLRQLVARFWLGRSVQLYYQASRAQLTDAPQRALLELVYGQLLMSCKLQGAMAHLELGFTLAAPLLAPKDYFLVLRRHRLLGRLYLSAAGMAPRSLSELMAEAVAIEGLEGVRVSASHPGERSDTVG